MSKDIKELLSKLDIKPNDIDLYITSLTHSSYANENNVVSYERLEFLGDAILSLIMAEYLYLRFEKEDEGNLTKIRAEKVCEKAEVVYANKLDLASYILLGKGEKKANDKILSDTIEAFIGAIYLDKGIEITKQFIYDHIILYYDETIFVDYKSKLQEYLQLDGERIIKYETIKESENSFFSEIIVDKEIKLGKGKGSSKAASEVNAAKDALSKLHI